MFTRAGIDPSPEMLDLVGTPPRRIGDTWLVTRYDDCKAVLAEPRFLGTGARPPGGPDPRPLLFRSPGWPGGRNGPALRREIAPLFTPRRIAALPVQALVESLLDSVESAGGPADLRPAFTFPLPARAICALLDLPVGDLDSLARWSSHVVTPPFLIDPAVAQESFDAMFAWFSSALGTPDPTRVGLAMSLFVAGHETTASQLDYGIVALLRHPAQAALVRSSDAVAATAVEEIMRYFPINADGVPRVASCDLEVGGVTIPAGSLVVVGGPAAAFDPAVFPDALRFDVTRRGRPHLSFGHGAHYCIGAVLARLELQVALPAVLRRFPSLKLVHEELRVKQDLAGGLEELLVTW